MGDADPDDKYQFARQLARESGIAGPIRILEGILGRKRTLGLITAVVSRSVEAQEFERNRKAIKKATLLQERLADSDLAPGLAQWVRRNSILERRLTLPPSGKLIAIHVVADEDCFHNLALFEDENQLCEQVRGCAEEADARAWFEFMVEAYRAKIDRSGNLFE